MARIAVIGAGWAGLSAALALQAEGHDLSVFEMAPAPGGRARSLPPDEAGPPLDNGQHILIGAYTETLDLLASLGLAQASLFRRSPLQLTDAAGRGLRLPKGPPQLTFAWAVLHARHWSWSAQFSVLGFCLGWALRGFRCRESLTVRELCQGMHRQPYEELVAPLCVAALNTPAEQASARVFLRVLKDALFSGRGSADLLLPRQPLSAVLPDPALAALRARGARVQLGRRALLGRAPDGRWTVQTDGAPAAFDAVVLACPAREAARQLAGFHPAWAAEAEALRYEPIVTVYLRAQGQLPFPMVSLKESAIEPAQYLFDHGALGLAPGRFAAVISGAGAWLDRGPDGVAACAEATLAQVARQAAPLSQLRVERVLTEKRATFACTPGLKRPAARIAAGLWAAGDYLDGPYPATLEGAVRSGRQTARGLLAELGEVAPHATH
ncbi:hydroxysqualene dehydroxylase HpnE [Pelomonas sp. APW6]|uniref:Hydroxysqualene dehydroxylase HpnE n=1 Tax=Roseateles subflavus TaxID=3053353 RepID=A0ABT7LH50_9BURK|nr:hydroxysqualene dehydroxylase HpnE [Pelomonas sp. APW6]MDL5032188.1 hydroxysqualene dehydroxylase HpnE [Pelomonas sp. APW6]